MFDIIKLLNLDRIVDNLVGYVETKVEYHKIQLKEELAKALSLLIFIVIMSFMILLTMIFISFLAVSYLNELLSSQYLGFIILIVFYIGMIVILVIFRRKWVYDGVYKILFSETEAKSNNQL